MSTIPKTSYQSIEALTRWASRVPDFTVIGTVPANAATNVPVNQTINISFPIAIDATTANSTNITMSPSVGRTRHLVIVKNRNQQSMSNQHLVIASIRN